MIEVWHRNELLSPHPNITCVQSSGINVDDARVRLNTQDIAACASALTQIRKILSNVRNLDIELIDVLVEMDKHSAWVSEMQPIKQLILDLLPQTTHIHAPFAFNPGLLLDNKVESIFNAHRNFQSTAREIQTQTPSNDLAIKFTAVSLNNAFKPHRTAVLGKLFQFDNVLSKQNFPTDNLAMSKVSWFKKLPKKIQKSIILNSYKIPISSPLATQNYAEAFRLYSCGGISIITETIFEPKVLYFSEKSLIPLIAKRPFIIVGTPKTLHLLRSFGFKTFSDYWDESYDDELCPTARMVKIFALFDQVLKYSVNDVQEILLNMSSILEYNYHLGSSIDPKTLIKSWKDLNVTL